MFIVFYLKIFCAHSSSIYSYGCKTDCKEWDISAWNDKQKKYNEKLCSILDDIAKSIHQTHNKDLQILSVMKNSRIIQYLNEVCIYVISILENK